MQRDPYSNEQLKYDRKAEGFWPKHDPDRFVFIGIALIVLTLVVLVCAVGLLW